MLRTWLLRSISLAMLSFGLAGLAVAADPAPAASAAVPGPGPQDLMVDVSNRLLKALDDNRAELRKDPTKAFPLVEQILLPHFDTDYAARLVLGQNWRTATPDQRKRFVAALYQALLKTYGGALTDFTADRLKILPFRGDLASDQATVRTEIRRDSGDSVPVAYTMRRTPQGWKVWDVVIEGISYVRSYRTDLGAEVTQKGLDAVITRLEREGLKAPATAGSGAAAK